MLFRFDDELNTTINIDHIISYETLIVDGMRDNEEFIHLNISMVNSYHSIDIGIYAFCKFEKVMTDQIGFVENGNNGDIMERIKKILDRDKISLPNIFPLDFSDLPDVDDPDAPIILANQE